MGLQRKEGRKMVRVHSQPERAGPAIWRKRKKSFG
jgi:hypothetical protein